MPDGTPGGQGLRHARVLVVDDERDVREGVMDLLETSFGAQPVGAGSAQEALTLIEASPFDLVITDFRMPGMNGVQFLDIVRARHPGLPCILMTAFDRDLVQKLGGRAKGERILQKPLEPERVLDQVSQSLGGKLA